MLFNDFIKYIPKIEKETLLSTDAHAKMAPLERISYLKEENYMDNNPRKAAVLMLFYPKNKVTHLALIVRNSYPGVHSSQIGFPGGKVEEFDADLEETALRETHICFVQEHRYSLAARNSCKKRLRQKTGANSHRAS